MLFKRILLGDLVILEEEYLWLKESLEKYRNVDYVDQVPIIGVHAQDKRINKIFKKHYFYSIYCHNKCVFK